MFEVAIPYRSEQGIGLGGIKDVDLLMASTMNEGQAALSFLKKNSLEPTPANYCLAYQYVTETNPAVVRAVGEIAADGMRLTQEEADRIAESTGCRSRGDRAQAASRHQERETARVVASIVEAAMATTRMTQDFGRDLAQQGAAIRENPTADQLAESLRTILLRTDQAERDLNAASADVAKLREELELTKRKAETDDLTGLKNRRAIRNVLDGLDAEGAVYSVAIIDIDHFKSINDAYGHDVGDRALRHVARCLSETLTNCEVARWGGEEFLVLSHDPSAQALGRLVDSARVALAKSQFSLRANDPPMRKMTFSAGISSKSDNADSTVRIADLRAYDAKRAGRNTVIVDAG
ncbi:MAG: GGDEF domain-containing protein [Sphingomonadaceae bacterium]